MKKIKLITAILMMQTFCMGQIIYVPNDQPTIQAAIDASIHSDTILVEDGTYYENINFKGKAITVASHFIIDGDEDHIDSTIIDGSQFANPDSASVVMFVNGEDTTSVICGFTITGGTGLLDLAIPVRIGGGIICNNSGAKITHNIIIDNEVNHNHIAAGGGIGRIDDFGENWVIISHNTVEFNQCSTTGSLADGGGMALTGKVIISNNTIANNHTYSLTGAARGAGLFHEGHDFMPDSVIVDQNIIIDNISESVGQYAYGGGIMIWYSKAFITNNTISNNTVLGEGIAFYGGGVSICSTYGELEFSGNYIAENSIPIDTAHIGVGLYIWSPFDKVHIHDNEFIENTAPVFGYNGAGGGIAILDAGDIPVFIEHNIFRDNETWNAGALYIKFATNVVISNNLFTGNTAFMAGGICIWQNASTSDYHFEIVNNTFAENYAETTGGAFRLGGEEGEDMIFLNNIFWGNEAGISGNSIFNNSQSDTLRIFYSNIAPDDISGLWIGENNINVNPDFIDDSCHLAISSQCIEAGVASFEFNGITFECANLDIDGQFRPLNSTADIGVDEVLLAGTTSKFYNSESSVVLDVFPNPFSNQTTIEFTLPDADFVTLSMYDITGKQLKTILSKKLSKGIHQINWNAKGLNEGIYFIRLETNTGSIVQKAIILN